MMWIELLRTRRFDGVARHAGWRRPVSERVGGGLLAQGAARVVPGPHPGRQGPGYGYDFDLTEVDGVGEATAEAVYSYCDRRHCRTAEQLDREGLEAIDEISAGQATAITEYLTE